jgi:hypothetical protein
MWVGIYLDSLLGTTTNVARECAWVAADHVITRHTVQNDGIILLLVSSYI